MPRRIQLACLCLALFLAACASPAPTDAPAISPGEAPAAFSLEIVATPTSVTSAAGGITLTAANWQRLEDRPDRDRLQLTVCFTPPDDRGWWLQGATLTVDGVPLAPTSASGEDAAEGQTCQTLAFAVPVASTLTAPVLRVPALRTQPAPDELCTRLIPEVQRRLAVSQPGLRVACEMTELGPQAWVTQRPPALSARAAQEAFEAAQAEVDQAWHTLPGPWSVTLPTAGLPRLARLSLLDPATQPTPPPLAFTLQAVQHYPRVLRLKVCFAPPTAEAWRIGEAVLEAGLTEVPLTTAAWPADPACEWLTAEWPLAPTPNPRLKIYALHRQMDPAQPGACATAVARLNTALAARDYGVAVACDQQAWGWQIKLMEKPPTLSEVDAQTLIHSDELDAVRGLWVLPVVIPPVPDPAPAAGEPGLTAEALVNVRAGPGLDFAVIGQIWPEEAYAIVGQAGAWWQIRYGAPGGWVSAEVVRPLP